MHDRHVLMMAQATHELTQSFAGSSGRGCHASRQARSSAGSVRSRENDRMGERANPMGERPIVMIFIGLLLIWRQREGVG